MTPNEPAVSTLAARVPFSIFSGAPAISKARSRLVNPGDEELVARAQQGDRRAFEELVERHKQKSYYIAFDFSRDREDDKDLSKE